MKRGAGGAEGGGCVKVTRVAPRRLRERARQRQGSAEVEGRAAGEGLDRELGARPGGGAVHVFHWLHSCAPAGAKMRSAAGAFSA